MFYFHKVAYVQYLGEVDIFSYMSKTFLPLYNSAKIVKIDWDFPKLWSQMYCHRFMVHSVYTVLDERRAWPGFSASEGGARTYVDTLTSFN